MKPEGSIRDLLNRYRADLHDCKQFSDEYFETRHIIGVLEWILDEEVTNVIQEPQKSLWDLVNEELRKEAQQETSKI